MFITQGLTLSGDRLSAKMASFLRLLATPVVIEPAAYTTCWFPKPWYVCSSIWETERLFSACGNDRKGGGVWSRLSSSSLSWFAMAGL